MVTKKVMPAVKTVKKTAVKKPVAKKANPAAVVKPAAKSPIVKSAAAKKPSPDKKAKPDVKAARIKKPKLVRDSFTMPQSEYDVLAQVKKSCIAAGIEIKKSDLLRIGVAMLQQLDTKKINEALQSLTPLKAGRPSKHK